LANGTVANFTSAGLRRGAAQIQPAQSGELGVGPLGGDGLLAEAGPGVKGASSGFGTDRVFLAALLHRLPKVRLRQLRLIVSPDTILRWHRGQVRRHDARISRWKHPGRPPTRRSIQALVLTSCPSGPRQIIVVDGGWTPR